MFTISDKIHVKAPIERCFLLSTDIELVGWTLGMKPIEGKTSGRIVAGDTLMWAGWKFGFPQMHETLITRYEPPDLFEDTMRRGRFRRFQHEHTFAEVDGYTIMTDKVRFSMPLGFAGRLVGRYIMVPYIARTLRRRLSLLQRIAESEEWRQFLPED
jgi:ligand-binding SRPBCC domain-containing protein